jgi:hypothetical protein
VNGESAARQSTSILSVGAKLLPPAEPLCLAHRCFALSLQEHLP